MKEYTTKEYTIPTIEGISKKTIETHLGLYNGYVTNLNTHYEKIRELQEQDPENTLVMSALTRRITFELAGIRNHEYYFSALEEGPSGPSDTSALAALIKEQHGSFESFIKHIQGVAGMMRGVGWVMVAYDRTRDTLHTYWIVDHELGNVNLPTILAIDMWEHSYMIDYLPADKGNYVTAYLNAINWKKVEENFDAAQ